jgi:SOS-response transcriptional repressor LexA
MNEKKFEAENEEFFRIPKAEFIIKRHKGDRHPLHIGSLVKNESMSIPDRLSLEVKESGMEKSGIRKGDHVVVEKNDQYYEGDILAIQLDERILLRRLYNTKGRLRLECDSATSPTIIVENRTPGFSILGRVIQVIREL